LENSQKGELYGLENCLQALRRTDKEKEHLISCSGKACFADVAAKLALPV